MLSHLRNGILIGFLRFPTVDSLTDRPICVFNLIDTDAGPTTRRPQGGRFAHGWRSPSSSTKGARRSLRRRARTLRPSRLRAGQVRDAAPPPGRRAARQPCGSSFRDHSTGILCRRSGLSAARDSRTVTASSRTPAQSQVHRAEDSFARVALERLRVNVELSLGCGGRSFGTRSL